MQASDKLKLAALLSSERIGAKHLTRLLQGCKTVEAIWNSSTAVLGNYVPSGIAQEVVTVRSTVDLDHLSDQLSRVGASLVSFDEPAYPTLLEEVADRPVVLFVRGDVSVLTKPAVAIVGARRATSYGLDMTEELAATLAQAGVVVISGLALGIDGIAHQAASRVGTTVAVLGCGIDRIYPESHRSLGASILSSGGAIVSEYPPGIQPLKQHFPARNRIIAGLTLGVIVVEALADSGALITAELALDYNREVWAIPHDLNRATGEGCHKLIRAGATLIRGADDVISSLGVAAPADDRLVSTSFSKEESTILGLLGESDLEFDELVLKSHLPVGGVSAVLTSLELAGMVRLSGSNRYSRKRKG